MNEVSGAGRQAAASPFHDGELAVQERIGIRDKIEPYGRAGIRSFMPEQHREFFEQLPFFLMGVADPSGAVWASMLVGTPGFVRAPDPKRLEIAALPGFGDPAAAGLRDGAAVGGLGIELHTRRRNRVNGRAAMHADGRGFSVLVDQSFGNCAQYIQARRPSFVRAPGDQAKPRLAHRLDALDAAALRILAEADTFFVATRSAETADDPRHGLDISHRGGRTGFLTPIDERTLVWPDYRGNFFFNTLGNLAVDPRCGILVIDFERGDTLQLTGRAEVVWDFDRAEPAWRGAQRLVRFRLETAVRIEGASPFAWWFQGAAPQFTRG